MIVATIKLFVVLVIGFLIIVLYMLLAKAGIMGPIISALLGQ